jgi:hypothetical protein
MELFPPGLALIAFFALGASWIGRPYDPAREVERARSCAASPLSTRRARVLP